MQEPQYQCSLRKERTTADERESSSRSSAATSSPDNKPDPRNALNELTAREWIPETVSVWTQRGLGAKHPDAQIEREHPAPFSFSDVRRLVALFTKRGQTVLDPFCGVGSTLKACALEGRNGVGIELNPKYVALTKRRLENELVSLLHDPCEQTVIDGDSRLVLKTMDAHSVDFIVTSPPYWSILHKEDHKAKQGRRANNLDTTYGDDPRDLGNIESYQDFLAELVSILREGIRVLRPKKYMALVVSDFRQKSRYIMFHSDVAAMLESEGLELKGIKILYQRHKRVFPYGYPFAYVPNIHHQYILVFQKPKGMA